VGRAEFSSNGETRRVHAGIGVVADDSFGKRFKVE
jgi:hypothetical protein